VDQIGPAHLPRALADFVQRQTYGWGPFMNWSIECSTICDIILRLFLTIDAERGC
jgi:hypothetical protein